jgi:hypothetical protein
VNYKLANKRQVYSQKQFSKYQPPALLAMNIFKHIQNNFGQPVLQLARKLEKMATQSASWKNHLTFNHQCKRLAFTPPSLRLHTNMQGQAAQHIIATAQKKLTTVRISQCHERLRCLNVTHQHLTASLASSLPPPGPHQPYFPNPANHQHNLPAHQGLPKIETCQPHNP